MKKNNSIITFTLIFFILLNCLNNKEVKTINKTEEYYTLSDVLNEMKMSKNDFIKSADASNKKLASAVKNKIDMDHESEALASIIISNNNKLNTDQNMILAKYFPKESNETFYKIISETLKARVESIENEDISSLTVFLKEMENKSGIKFYNDSPDQTSDISILETAALDFYKKYISSKIEMISKEEFKPVKQAFAFNDEQTGKLSDTIKLIYFFPGEKSNDVIVTVGAVISVFADKRDMNGNKPYMCIWNAYSNTLLRTTAQEYHETWKKNVELKIKKEGTGYLTKILKGQINE